MSKKYFRNDDNELCFPLSLHYDYMRENNLKTLKVYEAKPDIGSGFFWCTEFFEVGTVGEGCGVQCEKYQPRNGKNGRCKFSSHTYEATDVTKILTL